VFSFRNVFRIFFSNISGSETHARLFDAKTCGELTDSLQYLAGGDWSHVKA